MAKKTKAAETAPETEQEKRAPILGIDVKGELRDVALYLVQDPDGVPDRMARPGDAAAIEQLARSMRECGQLQPVMVEVINPGKAESYRRVFGRRRIAAARSLNWATIRASVVGELPPAPRPELKDFKVKPEAKPAAAKKKTAKKAAKKPVAVGAEDEDLEDDGLQDDEVDE